MNGFCFFRKLTKTLQAVVARRNGTEEDVVKRITEGIQLEYRNGNHGRFQFWKLTFCKDFFLKSDTLKCSLLKGYYVVEIMIQNLISSKNWELTSDFFQKNTLLNKNPLLAFLRTDMNQNPIDYLKVKFSAKSFFNDIFKFKN